MFTPMLCDYCRLYRGPPTGVIDRRENDRIPSWNLGHEPVRIGGDIAKFRIMGDAARRDLRSRPALICWNQSVKSKFESSPIQIGLRLRPDDQRVIAC
jgi:hypothetical protein